MLEEQRLDPDVHDCAGFDCGIAALNDYLNNFATQHRRRGISQTYVLVDLSTPSVVWGYYTLSAAQIDVAQLYPIPCFRMGRLACQKDLQGNGLGRLLLGRVVERCLKARENVASYALIVDAKNDSTKAFCEHYGFIPCVDQSLMLYLPLGK